MSAVCCCLESYARYIAKSYDDFWYIFYWSGRKIIEMDGYAHAAPSARQPGSRMLMKMAG